MSKANSTHHIYFPYLDVVRFIAAFLIVIVHGYEAWTGWYGEIGFLTIGDYRTLTPMGEFIDQAILNLSVGVDIFFLLSGFLITYILLKEKEAFGKINVKYFIIRRTFRIWPLYFLIIAIAPFAADWVGREQPDFIPNLLFLGNFHAINTQEWQYPFAHFWSICVEEHFYLLWPFFIQWIPKKRLLHFFGALILFSIAFRMYAFSCMENSWYVIYTHTLSRMDVLVIGAIGAYFYAKKPFEFKLNPLVRKGIWLALILVLGMSAFGLWDTIYKAGFKKFVSLILIVVLMLDYNFNSSFSHSLKKKSFVHYLGKVSYGIYMYHNVLLLIIVKQVMWPLGSGNMYLFWGVYIALTLGISILSFEVFEKHVLKLNKRFRLVKTDR